MFNETTTRAQNEQRDGKPGRLRAACTCCHAAKVRCSGEKNGCTRCRTLGYECVYLESRVGKTRGRRKRHTLSPGICAEGEQRMTPVPGQGHRAIAAASPTEDISNTNTGGSSGEHGPVPSPQNSSADAEFLNQDLWGVEQSFSNAAILETMPELPAMDFFLDYPETELHDHGSSPSWKDTNIEQDTSEPGRLDSAIDLSDVPSISPRQQPTRRVETNRPATHGFTQARPSMAYRHTSPMAKLSFRPDRYAQDNKGVVVAAAEILEQLENKTCAGLSAIDEVLRTNKEATQRISELTCRSDYTSSIGCSIVVVAAAHHVVCLFESACGELYSPPPNRGRWSIPSRSEDSQHNPNSTSFGNPRRRSYGGSLGHTNTNGLPPAPGIGFGSFLLDPQEQAALGAQIISTELHRSLRMVQSLSVPLQTGFFAPDPAGVAVDGWLQDLKQRLRCLISAVESSERIWPR
ncbi:hypothetical protein BJX76DRAFT_358096 [Aspergillus varians]